MGCCIARVDIRRKFTERNDEARINETRKTAKNPFESTAKIKNENFMKKVDSLDSKYKILESIGKGTYGKVFKVVDIQSGQIRAMKSLNRAKVEKKGGFMREIEILMTLDHPNILKIYEYSIDEVNIYIISEYISGGELVDCISKEVSFDEHKAAYIMKQIFSAVYYLHSKMIVHRDLKLENILVENDNKSEHINIKIIDFGTCCYITPLKKLNSRIGTPYYIAPEVLRKEYDERCDIWSCGVILYFLLVGKPPFNGDSLEEIFAKINNSSYSLSSSEWNNVSSYAKDLVKSLLNKNQETRPSAEECLKNPWFEMIRSENKIDTDYAKNIMKNLKNFNAKEKIQQATIAFIVHSLGSNEEIQKLKEIFNSMDTNGDGRLTYQELKNGYDKINGQHISYVEFQEIINKVDQDNDGFIEYHEFLRVCVDQKILMKEENLKQAFVNFDENKDGKLSTQELKKILGTSDNQVVLDLIKNIDKNKDGVVSYQEFTDMMKSLIGRSSLTFVKSVENFDGTF